MGSQSSVPWEQSGATFHLHYLGHRIKYGSLEVGNMWVCCSIAFTESFLFWFILVTYNIGIYICYIFVKLAVFILFFLVFIIFNCNVFSALHAKHFEILKNFLWNCWVDCFIAWSIKWYDISWFYSESIFPFMEYFFLTKTVFSLVSLCFAYRWVNQLRYFW